MKNALLKTFRIIVTNTIKDGIKDIIMEIK
jgi:hypothetical protein